MILKWRERLFHLRDLYVQPETAHDVGPGDHYDGTETSKKTIPNRSDLKVT
jgi:hypothetical protein